MFKLSIIIPAYNVQEYIVEALDSVFNQVTDDEEVILINDGSTDATLDLAKTFEKNSNYKIISTSNKGLSSARNLGVKHANGEYIYFFDSDDVLSINFVKKIKKSIKNNNNPDLICFSGGAFFDDSYDGGYSLSYERNINKAFSSGAEAFTELYKVNGLKSSACLYTVRKRFFVDNSLSFKDILHEDEEILLPLFFLAGSTVVINDILFLRRVRKNSIMTKEKTHKNLYGYIQTIDTLIDFKSEYPELCNKWLKSWKDRGQDILITTLILKKKLGDKVITKVTKNYFIKFADYRIIYKLMVVLLRKIRVL